MNLFPAIYGQLRIYASRIFMHVGLYAKQSQEIITAAHIAYAYTHSGTVLAATVTDVEKQHKKMLEIIQREDNDSVLSSQAKGVRNLLNAILMTCDDTYCGISDGEAHKIESEIMEQLRKGMSYLVMA